MQTIFELKEQAVTDTPLLLFDCVLPDGRTEHWSTHAVTVREALVSTFLRTTAAPGVVVPNTIPEAFDWAIAGLMMADDSAAVLKAMDSARTKTVFLNM